MAYDWTMLSLSCIFVFGAYLYGLYRGYINGNNRAVKVFKSSSRNKVKQIKREQLVISRMCFLNFLLLDNLKTSDSLIERHKLINNGVLDKLRSLVSCKEIYENDEKYLKACEIINIYLLDLTNDKFSKYPLQLKKENVMEQLRDITMNTVGSFDRKDIAKIKLEIEELEKQYMLDSETIIIKDSK